MARRRSSSYLLPHLLATFFGRPITVRYPFGPLELPEAYRGHVVVDIATCQGCGLCVRDCPAQALAVERNEDAVCVRVDDARCAMCGQCELSCRHGAIRLAPGYPEPNARRDAFSREWRRECKGG